MATRMSLVSERSCVTSSISTLKLMKDGHRLSAANAYQSSGGRALAFDPRSDVFFCSLLPRLLARALPRVSDAPEARFASESAPKVFSRCSLVLSKLGSIQRLELTVDETLLLGSMEDVDEGLDDVDA